MLFRSLISVPKIYFRLDALSNFTCENRLSYSLDELPLHSQVIQMFENRHTGKYYIPLETQGDPTWKKLQHMM